MVYDMTKNIRGAGRKPLPEKSVAVNILFPAAMAEYVKKQVEIYNYKSIAEYVRELVRKDMKQGD